MKLPAVLLVGSVAVNATLLGALMVKPTLAPPKFQSYFESGAAREERTVLEQRHAAERAKRAAADESRSANRWRELGTDDLKLLTQRLLAAGFPPDVVRSVIVAEIGARYTRQYAEISAGVETKYWEPDGRMDSKTTEARNRIARERAALTREILGDALLRAAGSDAADPRSGFANLPPGKADVVQRIVQDYTEMAADIRSGTRGITLPEDREKLALLDRERHADLAGVLTPQELEDFEMRTSSITGRLRTAMSLMDATEDEFRSIYRVYQKYDAQLNPLVSIGGGTYSSELLAQRNEAQRQLQAEVLAALGKDRAGEYLRASNYEYQQLAQLAKRENLPADAATRAFELRDGAAQESQRIAGDTTLTLDQKRAALQTLAQDTRAKYIATLGPTAGAAYAKSAMWLQAIERGSSVKFEGTMTSFSTVHDTVRPRQ